MVEDRTRDHISEPPGGATREEYIKANLKAAYRGAGSTPINSRQETVTGRALSDRFTWQLEVLQWVAEPFLTHRQVQIVELIYRDDLLLAEVADRLNVNRVTVSRDRHYALETLIRIAYHDPSYSLPWRVYRRPDSHPRGFGD